MLVTLDRKGIALDVDDQFLKIELKIISATEQHIASYYQCYLPYYRNINLYAYSNYLKNQLMQCLKMVPFYLLAVSLTTSYH